MSAAGPGAWSGLVSRSAEAGGGPGTGLSAAGSPSLSPYPSSACVSLQKREGSRESPREEEGGPECHQRAGGVSAAQSVGRERIKEEGEKEGRRAGHAAAWN